MDENYVKSCIEPKKGPLLPVNRATLKKCSNLECVPLSLNCVLFEMKAVLQRKSETILRGVVVGFSLERETF